MVSGTFGAFILLRRIRIWAQRDGPSFEIFPSEIRVLEQLEQLLLSWLPEDDAIDSQAALEPTELFDLGREGQTWHEATNLVRAGRNPVRHELAVRVAVHCFGFLEENLPRI